jgi:hypothetical protein
MGLIMRLIVNKGKCNQYVLKHGIYYFINVHYGVFRANQYKGNKIFNPASLVFKRKCLKKVIKKFETKFIEKTGKERNLRQKQ